MSKRDIALYIEDILDSAKAIQEFVDGMGKVIWDLTKCELDTLVENIENFKEGGIK